MPKADRIMYFKSEIRRSQLACDFLVKYDDKNWPFTSLFCNELSVVEAFLHADLTDTCKKTVDFKYECFKTIEKPQKNRI